MPQHHEINREFDSSAIEERFARVAGHRMRYLNGGSGPPLVLVHGLLGYSYCWRRNLEALARVATIYAIDLLGAGYSDRPANLDCRLAAAGRRVLEFMDAAGIQRADMLGNSHGGAVVIEAAAQAKERVRSLLLLAPVTPFSEVRRRKAVRFFTSKLGTKIAPLGLPLRLAHTIGLRRLYGDQRLVERETVTAYMNALRQPGTLDHVLHILRCWHEDVANLNDSLQRVADLPALLIWGGRDRAVALDSAEPLRNSLQNAELHVIEGVGHLVAEEAPGQFNQLVLRFLENQNAEHAVAEKLRRNAGTPNRIGIQAKE